MIRLRTPHAPRFWPGVVLAAAVACAASAPLPAQELSPAQRVRIDSIFTAMDRTDTPGCALGIYRDGRIVYARGYGMANLELGVAISPRTVFDIGSTSKQFAAASVILLAQDGRLSLDDDVRKHIPELPAYQRPITIRHLLHHTSGLRDYLTLFSLKGIHFDNVTTARDALDIITRQRALNFDPGAEHLYSNSGYFLLSEIVLRASGQSLPAFAEQRIFGPLGMRNTHFHDDHTMIVTGRATGYARRGSGWRIDMSGFEQTGDGAVLTTVEDLLLWDRNFYTPTVGGQPLLDALHTTGQLNSGTALTYAAGLTIDENQGIRRVRHGGSWAGYRADLLRFPTERTSIACLCNYAGANPSALADRVATVLIPNAPQFVAAPAMRPGAEASGVMLSPSYLERLAGLYRDPSTEETRNIVVQDGTLRIPQILGPTPLSALDSTRFRAPGVPVEFTFGINESPVRLRERRPNGTEATFEKFTRYRPTAAELTRYTGSWYAEELDARYTISAAGDTALTVRAPSGDETVFMPTVRDVFVRPGMALIFQRDPRGQVTGFAVNAGRVRGIRFRR